MIHCIFIIISERNKTQQMKIKYLLIPLSLVLSGCKNSYNISYPSAISGNKLNNNVYINVRYDYVFNEHTYYVFVDDNTSYKVPPKNVYFIDYIEYLPDFK